MDKMESLPHMRRVQKISTMLVMIIGECKMITDGEKEHDDNDN